MRGVGRIARAGRDGVRLAAAGLERLVPRWPRLGLAALGALGAVSARDPAARKTPTAEQLAELFGPMPPERVRAVRGEIAATGHRNHGLRRLVAARGLEAALPLIERVEAQPLLRLHAAGVPAVVVGWHQGPLRSVELALHRLGVPCLVAIAEHGPTVELGPVRERRVAGGAGDAAFLKEALETLRAGGAVVTHLDWRAGHGRTVTILGRPIHVARGPGSLARIAGARLVPVVRRFRGTSGGIEVVFHEPLPEPALPRSDADAFERALLESAAAWFEAQLRSQPGTLRNDRVRYLLGTAGAPDSWGERSRPLS
jgi:lauroyl/myristoyl acyltransferase